MKERSFHQEPTTETIALGIEAENWQSAAACRPADTDLFYKPDYPEEMPDRLEKQLEKKRIEAAKEICKRCPVIETCLGWALKYDEDDGIWGGLTELERRRLKRSIA